MLKKVRVSNESTAPLLTRTFVHNGKRVSVVVRPNVVILALRGYRTASILY